MDLLLCPKGDVLRAAGEELLDLLVPLGSWGLERFCVHDWASWWHCLPSERKYLLMLAIQLSIPHWHRGEGEGVQDLGAHVWLYLFLQFTRVLVWHRIGLLWTLGVGLNYHTPVKNLAGVRSFLPRWDPEARVREKPSVRFISIFCWPFDSCPDLVINQNCQIPHPTQTNKRILTWVISRCRILFFCSIWKSA